jgi:hypothetical protein
MAEAQLSRGATAYSMRTSASVPQHCQLSQASLRRPETRDLSTILTTCATLGFD